MLRTSRILLKVATIVSTICGAIILAFVPVFLTIGFSSTIHDMLLEAIKDGTVTVHSSNGLSNEQMVKLFQVIFATVGFVFIIIGVLCVANAIIASKTRNEPTRGRYIACIITGALSTDFSLVGGIFGLISLARIEKNKQIDE